MILRKPYGFLIKHYKIINFILLIPMFYIALKFGDIASFFRDYISAKYSTPETIIAGKYITLLTYLVLILLIAYNLLLYVLMKSKKKQTYDYIAGTIYYLVLLVLTLFFYNTMKNIELRTATDAVALMARDISTIAVLPSYALLFLTVLKGIGFNIKTFRLDNNMDLQITEDDEAEFELKIGNDGYATKRTIVHALRELRYYILENKFVFVCIAAVFLVTIGTSIYMNFGVYNRKYNINQNFALDSFIFNVKRSFITDVDYGGNKIDDNYYLIVEIEIVNNGKDATKLYEDNFRVFSGKKVFYPSFDRSARFIDIANNYQGDPLFPQKQDSYILAYKIKKEDIKSSYQIKVLSNLQIKNGQLIPSYRIVKINPINITKHYDFDSVKMGTEITLKDTTLGNTKYTLKNITFSRNYTWKAYRNGAEVTDIITAREGYMLAVVSDKIKYDETTSYYRNTNHSFYADFATLKFNYTTGGVNKEYTSTFRDVTPSGVNDVKVYEVSSLAARGTNKKLVLNIRNKTITILIPDN